MYASFDFERCVCGPLNMHTPVVWLPVWRFTSTHQLLVLL